MYYFLHHSTGTLLLEAQDKLAVLSWSERQLGESAKRAAIFELGGDLAKDQVKKSETGIGLFSCVPFLSVMADAIQYFSEGMIEESRFPDRTLEINFKNQNCLVH